MQRRDFLRRVGASSLGALAMTLDHPFSPRFTIADAQTTNVKTLIVVFQRGGCDTMSAVVPYEDGDYYALRPDISIARPSADPESALDLDGFFGLHPQLAPLKTLYDDGELAVFPTAHYPDASRSHFRSQDWIEIGEPGAPEESSGWLSRYLDANQGTADIQAVGLGSSVPKILKGGLPVSVFNSLSSFQLNLPAEEEALLLASLETVYGQNPNPPTAYRTLVQEVGRVVIDDLDVVRGLDLDALGPDNGAVYPNSTFGRQMTDVARLIKARVGLEIATVNLGGWDTHSDQGAGGPNDRLARRFTDFAGGIAALRQDLGPLMDDVVVVTMSEFGRTIGQNASLGTDHGNAAKWLAVGTQLNGGNVYGTWPGLKQDALYRDRYLAHSVDFRDILADVLVNHMGTTDAELGPLLPGHTRTPTGLYG